MKTFLLLCLLTGISLSKVFAGSEIRNHDPFREISLRVEASLYFEQGDKQQIEITASEEALHKIITEVKDGKLIIRYSFEDRWLYSWKPGPVSIRVVSPQIEMLSVSGSGNIISEKNIETNFIELNIAGSGDIKIASLKSEKVKAIISGSGDIVFSGNGNASDLDVNINGSGDVRAQQFSTDFAKVWIAGSGDCSLTVNKHLDAKIFGSGDIRYNGDPTINSSITGSGFLRKMD